MVLSGIDEIICNVLVCAQEPISTREIHERIESGFRAGVYSRTVTLRTLYRRLKIVKGIKPTSEGYGKCYSLSEEHKKEKHLSSESLDKKNENRYSYWQRIFPDLDFWIDIYNKPRIRNWDKLYLVDDPYHDRSLFSVQKNFDKCIKIGQFILPFLWISPRPKTDYIVTLEQKSRNELLKETSISLDAIYPSDIQKIGESFKGNIREDKDHYHVLRIVANKESLNIVFDKETVKFSRYAIFNKSLDKPVLEEGKKVLSMREKYCMQMDEDCLLKYSHVLANRLTMKVNLIFNEKVDNALKKRCILARKASDIDLFPGLLTTSASGGWTATKNHKKELGDMRRELDVAIIKETHLETCIPEEILREADLRIIGAGIEGTLLAPVVFAQIILKGEFSTARIKRYRTDPLYATRDATEHKIMEVVDYSPETLMPYIMTPRIWCSDSKTCLYWNLIRDFGEDAIESLSNKHLSSLLADMSPEEFDKYYKLVGESLKLTKGSHQDWMRNLVREINKGKELNSRKIM